MSNSLLFLEVDRCHRYKYFGNECRHACKSCSSEHLGCLTFPRNPSGLPLWMSEPSIQNYFLRKKYSFKFQLENSCHYRHTLADSSVLNIQFFCSFSIHYKR